MSLHQSLKAPKGLAKHRNVLKKRERLARLSDEGRWPSEGASVFRLPKIRNIKVVAKKGKAKEKPAAEAAAAAGTETAGPAAPPAGDTARRS